MLPKIFRRLFIFLMFVRLFCGEMATASKADEFRSGSVWASRADSAQTALEKYFWNPSEDLFYSNSAGSTTFNYWWQAHAIDVLVDGFMRTEDSSYLDKISLLYKGITIRNNGFIDGFYDDMGWMALALLRAFQVTGNSNYLMVVRALWKNIQTGWDSTLGGGIYWQKSPRMFKNVAANAPACILACRLYKKFGNGDDLAWAEKIHSWLKATLVDSISGTVYDGINTQGTLHKQQYTYNYGTYLGSCLELYKITKDSSYLNEATRTANVADSIFAPNGILRDDGTGDGGLFNGIYVRYLAQLVLEPDLNYTLRSQYERFLEQNAASLWRLAQEPGTALFNHDWQTSPTGDVDLSVELSGVMLLEAEALIDRVFDSILHDGASSPTAYSLAQNYPNPFNPNTVIRYTISQSDFVSLKVYNVLGEEVATLVNKEQVPGSYLVIFDASKLPSGIYLCRLVTSTFCSTRKMSLIK